MARLPTPGGDDNTWGNILNSFLEVSLNSDGTLITSAVQQAGAVTTVNAISPTNGSLTLSTANLSDTAISNPTTNQVLTYISGKWTNQTSPSAPVTSVNGMTGAVSGLLLAANNLSDLAAASTARTNLGLGSAATMSAGSANGVATLDATGNVPVSELGNVSANVRYRGAWAANTAYNVDDAVSNNGGFYVCTTAHTSGSSFSGTDWTELSAPSGTYLVYAAAPSGDATGVTDTTAIQAIINAQSPSFTVNGVGAGIILQAGTYYITNLTLGGAIWLCGRGLGVTILQQASSPTNHLITIANSPHLGGIKVSDMTLLGTASSITTPGSYDIINVSYNPTRMQLLSLYINNSLRDAIYLGGSGSYGGSFLSTIEVGGTVCRNSINVVSGSSDIHMSSVECENAGDNGFVIAGSHIDLIGCKSNGCGVLANGQGSEDGFSISGSTNILEGCEAENIGFGGSGTHGNSYGVYGSQNRIRGGAAAATQSHLYLNGSNNDIEISIGDNVTNTQPAQVYIVDGTSGPYTKNKVRIHGSPTTATYGLLTNSGTESGNFFEIENESTLTYNSLQSSGNYGAALTPNPYLGGFISGTLNSALTLTAPTNAVHVGCEMLFKFVQGSSAYAVTFAGNWNIINAPSQMPNSVSFLRVKFDGTTWNQILGSSNGGSAALSGDASVTAGAATEVLTSAQLAPGVYVVSFRLTLGGATNATGCDAWVAPSTSGGATIDADHAITFRTVGATPSGNGGGSARIAVSAAGTISLFVGPNSSMTGTLVAKAYGSASTGANTIPVTELSWEPIAT